MSFSILDEHDVIGWDFDGTLIDHPKAQSMHDYILDHPEKTHIIVTFRSHGMERNIWRDLGRENHRAPGRAAFKDVINMSNKLFEEGYMAQKAVAASIVLPTKEYLEWKGKVCHDLGITVLVDDMPAMVIPGCDRYGVLHLHPNDL